MTVYTAKHRNLALNTDLIHMWRYFVWGKDRILFEK